MSEEAPKFDGVRFWGAGLISPEAFEYYKLIQPGDSFACIREPDNPVDRNAVLVGEFLEDEFCPYCYVERGVAAEAAPWMDSGFIYTAHIQKWAKLSDHIRKVTYVFIMGSLIPMGGPRAAVSATWEEETPITKLLEIVS